jgi:hypothetical protein
MKKTYTGVLRSAYFAPKKFINVLGQRILFIEGISREIPEDVALHLFEKKILASISENVTFEYVEEVVEFPSLPEFPEEPVFTQVFELPEMPEEPEFEVEENSQFEITKELLESLYLEHQTWSAVATHLNVTPARLKKYRDDLNL